MHIDKYSQQPNKEDAKYLISYINEIVIPASEEFFRLLNENEVMLHHAYSFNSILAHAIDYMVFIANKVSNVSRSRFIRDFDERYAVDGCMHINNKYALLDAVNNSFKHVVLDSKRYKKLIEKYGALSFHSLKSDNGKIFFDMPSYRFDYSRVVMRPIAAIFNCGIENTNDIDDFINGRLCGSTGYNHFDYEPHDAVDRMVDYCNPRCMECGESTDDCDCTNFIYEKSRGEFTAIVDPNFDFDDVMSDISGTRDWSK